MEKEKLDMYRHSMAHVLAASVSQVFNTEIKFGIGPNIDDGFYYDFDFNAQITPEHFEAIEKAMQEIINQNLDITKEVISKEQALKLFKDQPYKIELINELPDTEEISIYKLGDLFTDLCRGPHVENTKFLRAFAYKINRVAGAYWRGSEKNKMMQRLYVFGFLDKKELKEHLFMLEEAKKRDHRKLGRELELYFISEYAQGTPFFMPKGMQLKNTLIEYWRQMHKEAGYFEIETPMVMNRKLWETSGHWANYRENMYSFEIEEEDFAIKPMNCPGGMIYYKEQIHSYKEFPLRVGELGKVHRHEASGTLHGMFRVRCFTQDDAHIFMLPNQIESEVKNVIDLVDKMYTVFGLSYSLELSTRPEKFIGEVADWNKAEEALKNALNFIGKDYVVNEGDGAFYGPKIDIKIKDAIGRTWQCGTIQLDMQLPKRFGLEYVDEDGSKKEPVMIHRVVYGSLERFIGIITENFAGSFPTWLAPVQAKVLNIADSQAEYCLSLTNKLKQAGIRVEFDSRNEKIGKKIREAQLSKTNYMLVVGDKEVEDNLVAVRHRKNGDLGPMQVDKFIELILEEINSKAL